MLCTYEAIKTMLDPFFHPYLHPTSGPTQMPTPYPIDVRDITIARWSSVLFLVISASILMITPRLLSYFRNISHSHPWIFYYITHTRNPNRPRAIIAHHIERDKPRRRHPTIGPMNDISSTLRRPILSERAPHGIA